MQIATYAYPVAICMQEHAHAVSAHDRPTHALRYLLTRIKVEKGSCGHGFKANFSLKHELVGPGQRRKSKARGERVLLGTIHDELSITEAREGVLTGMELGSVTLKRIGFFCFPIKHSTHTLQLICGNIFICVQSNSFLVCGKHAVGVCDDGAGPSVAPPVAPPHPSAPPPPPHYLHLLWLILPSTSLPTCPLF